MSDRAIALLEEQVGLLRAILQALSPGASAARSSAAATVASDSDLDGPYGDPQIKGKDPRNWKGPTMRGRKVSECPPDYLDMLAEFYDWQAGQAAAKDERTAGGKAIADYRRQDAARARGWAERIRAGLGRQSPPGAAPAALAGPSFETPAFAQPDPGFAAGEFTPFELGGAVTMAWIRVESTVGRNTKFIAAGPAASWLWLCGLGYCQEGLTDGFIPREALPYLGVKNAAQLAVLLVRARLWDEAPGGWQIRDYLEHNRSASEVAGIRERRGAGGKLGGRPKKHPAEPSANHQRLETETIRKTHAVDVDVDASVDVAVEEDGHAAFMRFQAAYPEQRRKGGRMVQEAFLRQIQLAGGSAALFAALVNHQASEQWRDPNMVPGMDTWLTEERWRQVLPAQGQASANGRSKPAWAVPR